MLIPLLPLVACLLLASCASKPPASEPPVAPCPALAPLPARAMSDREVEIYWGRDIASYGICKGRLDAALGVTQ